MKPSEPNPYDDDERGPIWAALDVAAWPTTFDEDNVRMLMAYAIKLDRQDRMEKTVDDIYEALAEIVKRLPGRYLVFAGDHYRPPCGVDSLVFTSDDLDETLVFAREMPDTVVSIIDGREACDCQYSDGTPQWWQVVDTHTLTIIEAK